WDLVSTASFSVEMPENIAVVRTSATTGAGMEDLVGKITALADGIQGDSGGDFVAINARHAQSLQRARLGLENAVRKLTMQDHLELAASDLRESLAAYGEIAGKVDIERMLDQLFSSFCIGK
ncbi:MAG: tRNA uridine-5-carboxymethylaminomethyl(34) synthesis GTPase MnmE, partial [Opitutaceae bacterium]